MQEIPTKVIAKYMSEEEDEEVGQEEEEVCQKAIAKAVVQEREIHLESSSQPDTPNKR